jgi:predicted  nucleic acid-binding Zn-ribbon protein
MQMARVKFESSELGSAMSQLESMIDDAERLIEDKNDKMRALEKEIDELKATHAQEIEDLKNEIAEMNERDGE